MSFHDVISCDIKMFCDNRSNDVIFIISYDVSMSCYVMCYGVIPKASCIGIETRRLQSKEIIDKRSIELLVGDSRLSGRTTTGVHKIYSQYLSLQE